MKGTDGMSTRRRFGSLCVVRHRGALAPQQGRRSPRPTPHGLRHHAVDVELHLGRHPVTLAVVALLRSVLDPDNPAHALACSELLCH